MLLVMLIAIQGTYRHAVRIHGVVGNFCVFISVAAIATGCLHGLYFMKLFMALSSEVAKVATDVSWASLAQWLPRHEHMFDLQRPRLDLCPGK